MHDWLFEERNRRSDEDYITAARTLGLDVTAFSECLSEGRYEEEIAADREAGGSYGVLGTPTLFVNRRRVDGAVPAATFLEIVKEELNSVK
jgi:protein-disulfide isomerase